MFRNLAKQAVTAAGAPGTLWVALLLLTAVTAGAEPSRCEVTGVPRWQCCATKASPMPPCCMKGCRTAGRIIRHSRVGGASGSFEEARRNQSAVDAGRRSSELFNSVADGRAGHDR